MHLCVQAPVEFLRHCVTGIETCICLFSSRRRHTRSLCDWSSDVCSSDLKQKRHTRSLCDWSSDVCSSDRKSTRLNSSHTLISYAVFCLRSEEHTSEHQSHSDHVCLFCMR